MKYIIKYIILLLFWILFWIIYGTLFSSGLNILYWIFGRIPFNETWVLLVIQTEVAQLVLWVIGGTLGGIIGAAMSFIDGKIRWVLDICFWIFFWVIFLFMVASIFWLKNSTILLTGEEITHSQMPIIIFGGSGGVIGGLMSQVIDQRFLGARKK